MKRSYCQNIPILTKYWSMLQSESSISIFTTCTFAWFWWTQVLYFKVWNWLWSFIFPICLHFTTQLFCEHKISTKQIYAYSRGFELKFAELCHKVKQFRYRVYSWLSWVCLKYCKGVIVCCSIIYIFRHSFRLFIVKRRRKISAIGHSVVRYLMGAHLSRRNWNTYR